MSQRWSLKELYPSFDSEKFSRDFHKCQQLVEKIKGWVANNLQDYSNPGTKLKTALQLLIEFQEIYSLLSAYSYLKMSVDAKNKEAQKEIEKLEQLRTELTVAQVKLEKWLGELPALEQVLTEDPLLEEHAFFLRELAAQSRYLLSEEEESILSQMKNTGSRAWEKLQTVLTSSLLVEIERAGKKEELPLPVVRNLAYDPDPQIRQQAYQAEIKAYSKVEDAVAAALNNIKGEVLTEIKLRGYNSILEKTLLSSRMEQKTLELMLAVIQENLPAFRKYYCQKARLLGYEGGLPFYELFAPVGEGELKFTYQEARDFIVEKFGTFSDKLANFAAGAFDSKWIDAEPREGKSGGAFCANIHSLGESRILSNFSGSLNDVTTLAHELGHAYHGDCLKEESILNSHYPMPLAETASIFCETIIEQAALEAASKEEALTILENSLSGAGQVIVDIYSRFLFEKMLFTKREEASLSVEELKGLMLEAQKKAYGEGLDHDYLHPYMWLCKPHYYSAELNFYNFPYAFGLLFAKGLYAQYLKKGKDFIPEYERLLRATGKMTVEEVAQLIGINLQTPDFWQSSLDLIIADIEKFIALSQAI